MNIMEFIEESWGPAYKTYEKAVLHDLHTWVMGYSEDITLGFFTIPDLGCP